MTAEADGAQVVALLYGVAFAIEADILNASTHYHGLGAAGGLVEGAVGIVGAEVHPAVVALSGEFVL